MKSAFITGFVFSLVFLIPQILIGRYPSENKNNLIKISTNSKYSYPYQQPDPT